MKRVLEFIVSLWRREWKRIPRPAVAVPSACPWTEQDQRHLNSFLLSPSGLRFIARCRGLEYANAIAGCEDQTDYAHAAGRVAGCREMTTYIVGELAVNFDRPQEQPQPNATPEEETVEEYVERMTP